MIKEDATLLAAVAIGAIGVLWYANKQLPSGIQQAYSPGGFAGQHPILSGFLGPAAPIAATYLPQVGDTIWQSGAAEAAASDTNTGGTGIGASGNDPFAVNAAGG